MTRTPARRAAFTLVELLVVIALIGLLVAISMGAIARIRAEMARKNDDDLLGKLDTVLLTRHAAILEQVDADVKNNDPRFLAVLNGADAGGRKEVAKTLWTFAKVKNQLPMTFTEANSTTLGLPPSKVFASLPATAPANDGEVLAQSAACFYLAVTESGGGGVVYKAGDQQTGSVTVGGRTYPCFVDGQKNPIGYCRLLFADEVNRTPYTPADPYDPSGGRAATAIASNWTAGGMFAPPGTNVTSPAAANTAYPSVARHHVLTLVSFGQNKVPELPIGAAGDTDDRYSFRLRKEGAKGN